MTVTTTGAALYGFEPGNASESRGDADYIIPAEDIMQLEISERGQELKDSASLTVANPDGKYTGVVDHGHRLAFYIQAPHINETGSDDRYGNTLYGEGTYSPGYAHRWTGMVRPFTNTANGGGNYTLEIDAEDFVYAVLGMRRYYGNFNDAPLAGSEDAILNTVLREEAPEIDRSEIASVGDRTDMQINGDRLFNVLGEVISRSDAIVSAAGTSLVVREAGSLAPEFETTPTAGDYSGPEFESNDDELINTLRVVGGSDEDVDDEQTTVSSYATVTEEQRQQVRISTRKSRLSRIEVHTRTTGSGEGVNVRLQSDDDGQPVAPANSKSDIVSKQVDAVNLTDDGFTSFVLDDHQIAGRDPWLIIESNGVDGQEIGVDTVPAYRAWYPYPVGVEVQDPESQDKYRRREDRDRDKSITSFDAARDSGEGELRHRSGPAETISLNAQSGRMHSLDVGQLLTIEDPNLGAVGDYVVTQRDDTFQSSTLATSLTLHDLTTL